MGQCADASSSPALGATAAGGAGWRNLGSCGCRRLPMSEPGSRDPVTGVEPHILTEHREIRALGEHIENSQDLVEVLGLLQDFRTLLVGHFASEEARDGFFDVIRAMTPRQLAKVGHLEKEHSALLAEVDRVGESARACLEGPVAAVLAGARALVHRLRTHEAAEDALLLDTVYDDLGQGD
jgi:hypothetical protein